MPFAYPDRGQLKLAIIARVAAGETVRAICSEAGMPCADSVQVWRRADPGFAAELAVARRRGDWRRVYGFDEAVAAAFLARVAAGGRIRDLLARPGMPSQAAYAYWRRTNVGFQEALWRLRGARYGRRSRTGHGRYRAWDEAMADRILLAVMRGAVLRELLSSDRAFPCLAVVERWRREEPVWDRALVMAMAAGRRARWRGSPELMDEIRHRIVMGASLRSLGAQPDMPSAGTLYAWVKRWPAFADAVARACHWREEFLNDQMIDICQRNGPFGLAATQREAAPLQLRVNQLAKRPGWKRARAEREARARELESWEAWEREQER
jgi:hypothetical protein